MQTILSKSEAKRRDRLTEQSPPRGRHWWWGVALVMGLSTHSAWAYVDPGTGSYFFQLLIAGLAGAWFLVSSLKTKLLGRWKTPSRSATPAPGTEHRSRS